MADSEEQEEIMLCTIAVCAGVLHRYGKCGKRKRRSVWTKDFLLRREERGAYNMIMQELRLQDAESFRKYLRMNATVYEEFINMVGPHIKKMTTVMRKALSVEEKLAVTLRFLATGETYESLQYQFRIYRTTIARFVPYACSKIYECLKDKYLKLPDTKEQWKNIASSTQERWQFPNCIGAADGKHISIRHPEGSGSEFYNYKRFFSIVLLALVDHDYQFLYVDVGCQGRISDGGVYRHSSFYSALVSGSLNFPDPEPLPKSQDPAWKFDQPDDPVPFFIRS